jgi:hypothetical protein
LTLGKRFLGPSKIPKPSLVSSSCMGCPERFEWVPWKKG